MNLNEALAKFRYFIENLNINNTSQLHPFMLSRYVEFSDEKMGGMSFSGTEVEEYSDVLSDLYKASLDISKYSKKGIESLMQTAILRAVDLNNLQPTVLPRDKIKNALSELKSAITSKPRKFICYYPVIGIDIETLPVTFGNIAFLPGNEENIVAITKPLNTIIRSSKNDPPGKRLFKAHINKATYTYILK
jgi:hypothetical protein